MNMDMNHSEKQPSQSGTVAGQNKNLIYTANESGTVSIIDAASYKVIGTIKDEGTPHNVQVSPNGKVFAYTLPVKMEKGQKEDQSMNMSKPGSVVFYDAETGKLIKKVEVGNHPAHVVFTEDGKYVLVTNNADNNVALLDAHTYNLITNIPVGNGPHGFRISSDSKYAYVANMGEDTVSVVDVENRKEIKKLKVGKTPVTTGITKDGKTLVVTINSENSLAIVDLASENVQRVAVSKGPVQVYLEPDDKYAFVANQGTEDNPSNTVSKIDMATKQVVETIVTGKGAHGVVVTPDNKYVYVTNMYDNTVSVIDNSTNKVIQNIQVDAEPNGISYK
ncbi:YVTN family beta-propeller repeat-containing protein [Clostridium manihotivorum]|uniref:YVTN family beta-propeller repeat-containing protein n=2 Tax=Clostridium manihotivorum TaxID=2320868 RepID=A0A410E1U6_9CLOT|nr:YVTN family beta-propeller repeat-containing protein [Clostridium manihotivorum]